MQEYESDFAQYSWDKPHKVYRAFRELTYAEQFIHHGKFRLGNLRGYVTTEDERIKDDAEGHGIVYDKVTGITSDILNSYPQYIVCMAGPKVDLNHLKKQYGDYVVEIRNPELFLEQLAKHLMSLRLGSDIVKVRYEEAYSIADESLGRRHAYGYKDARFMADCEYRLVTSQGSSTAREAEHLYIDLGGPVPNATLLP